VSPHSWYVKTNLLSVNTCSLSALLIQVVRIILMPLRIGIKKPYIFKKGKRNTYILMPSIVGDVFPVGMYLIHKERSTCTRHDKYTGVLPL